MRFLSRAVFVLALLGGLGYGSYAFGRYVLSSKLFGSSVLPSDRSGLVAVTPPTVVTRKTQFKGSEPRVDVQVMDANDAGPGPEPPSMDDLRKNAEDRAQARKSNPTADSTPATDVRAPNNDKTIGEDGVAIGGDPDDEDALAARRRRRRRKRAEERAAKEAAANGATDTSAEDTARSSSGDGGSSTSDSSDSSDRASRETPRSSDSGGDNGGGESVVPRAERTITSSDSSPAVTKPRHRKRHKSASESPVPRSEEAARPREHRSRTIESPVPRPEGGESPVPMPE